MQRNIYERFIMYKMYKPLDLCIRCISLWTYTHKRTKMGSAMKNHDLYAVVTGDIISSSKFKEKQHEHLLSALKSSFRTIEEIWPNIIYAPFGIYRGDSFQGVLSKPEKALHVALVIRAM
jgi:hypothetical protein